MTKRTEKGNSLIEFVDDYVVIDIETTGLDPRYDDIIEISALKFENGIKTDKFSELVKPKTAVSSFISELTGITNEMLADAPSIDCVLPKFVEFIGDNIVVGHNVNFDINFVYDNCLSVMHMPFTNDFIDTLRLSRRYVRDLSNHKLSTLAEHFNIPYDGAHRALADCEITNNLYNSLKEIYLDYEKTREKYVENLSFDGTEFLGKDIYFMGTMRSFPNYIFEKLCHKCSAFYTDIFFSDCDYVVMSDYTYEKYKRGDLSRKMIKADDLSCTTGLKILSEYEFLDILNIPHEEARSPKNSYVKIDIKSLSTDHTDFDVTHPFYGRLCVFTGTLEKMKRIDAMQAVLDLGGKVANSVTLSTDFLILGNNDYCYSLHGEKSSKQKKAEKMKLEGKDIEILSENVFYDMLEL